MICAPIIAQRAKRAKSLLLPFDRSRQVRCGHTALFCDLKSCRLWRFQKMIKKVFLKPAVVVR